jgi:hypothetical protein
MALDPNIALGVRPLEVPNQLAQYGQIQQLMAARDAQQINALKMQEAQAALEERNALRRLNPSAPDYEQQLFRVNPQLGINYRKEAATTAAQEAARKKSEFDLTAARRKFGDDLKRNLSANPSDENVIAWGQDAVLQGIYTEDQVASTVQQLLTLPPQQRASILSQAGASPSELKPSTQTINRGGATEVIQVPAFGGAPTTLGAYQDVPLPANVQAQRIQIAQQSRPPAQPSAPVAVIDPVTNQPILVSREEALRGRMQPASGAPTLKPLTEGQTIKLRTDVAKDYKAATTALSQMDDLLDSIDKVKTAPGLTAATGFTGKYLPSFPEGKAAQAETRLANLRGKVTALGKATAAMSGAIGSIANQEWKILSDQIAVLDEVKGKGPLLEQIDLVEQQARGAIERIRDTYQKTRAEDFERFPQFRDLPAPKAPAGTPAAASSPNVVITPDGQSHVFPTPAAAAQFKKAAGIQ